MEVQLVSQKPKKQSLDKTQKTSVNPVDRPNLQAGLHIEQSEVFIGPLPPQKSSKNMLRLALMWWIESSKWLNKNNFINKNLRVRRLLRMLKLLGGGNGSPS